MATIGTSVDGTVKDLKTTLSLADGTTYVLQYVGGGSVNVAAADSAPSVTTKDRIVLGNREFATLVVISGENIYAWTNEDFTGYVTTNAVV